MKNTIEISDELIASYVDNHVTVAERRFVLLYLSNHPDELESVLILTTAISMQEDEQKSIIRMPLKSGSLNRKTGIIHSAAAFAPEQEVKSNTVLSVKGSQASQVWKRLDGLAGEMQRI